MNENYSVYAEEDQMLMLSIKTSLNKTNVSIALYMFNGLVISSFQESVLQLHLMF